MKSSKEETMMADEHVFIPEDETSENIVLTDNFDEEVIDDDLNADLINEKFDKMSDLKVGKFKLFPLIGTGAGLFLIILSIYLINFESRRVFDFTSSGEFNVWIVILALVGIILFIGSIVKLLELNTPFDNLMEKMDKIENNEIIKPEKKDTSVEVPFDESTFNIKTFNTKFSKKLRRPSAKKTQSTLDNIIPNSEKLSPKEEEEIEYQKAKLDTESIDDIF